MWIKHPLSKIAVWVEDSKPAKQERTKQEAGVTEAPADPKKKKSKK